MPDTNLPLNAQIDASFPDADFYSKIGALARTLTYRSFGKTHFDRMDELLDQVNERLSPDEQAVNKIVHQGPNISHRGVDNFFLFYRPSGPIYVQPTFMSLTMRENVFGYSEIPFPLLIRADSGQFKSIQRAADQYSSEGVGPFLGMALAFSKVLEVMPKLQNKLETYNGMRVFLSDPDGLYLCRAQKCSEQECDPQVNILRIREGSHCEIKDPSPAWVPKVKLTAQSHIRLDKLNCDKVELHQELDGFQQDSDNLKALIALQIRYTNPAVRWTEENVNQSKDLIKLLHDQRLKAGHDPHEVKESLDTRLSILRTLGRGDAPLVSLVTQLAETIEGHQWARLSKETDADNFGRLDRTPLRPPEASLTAARELTQTQPRRG